MSIHAAAPASAAASFLTAPAKFASATDASKTAVRAAVNNDADGDLQKDLATGENPYETLGSKVNVKA